jgi:hypothetical protein
MPLGQGIFCKSKGVMTELLTSTKLILSLLKINRIFFDQVKSGTARTTAVKTLLSIQAETKSKSMILAAKESYLKSKMDESKNDFLYLRLPDGKLTELKRYQYDLKQAEHEWQFNLTGILEGAQCQLSDENPLVSQAPYFSTNCIER